MIRTTRTLGMLANARVNCDRPGVPGHTMDNPFYVDTPIRDKKHRECVHLGPRSVRSGADGVGGLTDPSHAYLRGARTVCKTVKVSV